VLTIVILVLVLLLVFGALPTWPYSRSWGPYPAASLLVGVLLVLLVLWLLGVRP
jgi:hypothetical protein